MVRGEHPLPRTCRSTHSALPQHSTRGSCSLTPRREPSGSSTFRHVLEVLESPDVTSLAALAERTAMSIRTLQRLFGRFAGVGAKRMLVRARVMDAVAAMDRGDTRSMAAPNDLVAAASRASVRDSTPTPRVLARRVRGEGPRGQCMRGQPMRMPATTFAATWTGARRDGRPSRVAGGPAASLPRTAPAGAATAAHRS